MDRYEKMHVCHVCPRCQQNITKNAYKTKKVIVSNRVHWHKQCVRCQVCNSTAKHMYFKCNVPGVPGGFVCQHTRRAVLVERTRGAVRKGGTFRSEKTSVNTTIHPSSSPSSLDELAREKRVFTKCIVCHDLLGKFPVTYMHAGKGAHIIHEKCKEQYEADYLNGIYIKDAKCAKCGEDYLPEHKNKWCIGNNYDYCGEISLNGKPIHKFCVKHKCSICDKMIGSNKSYMIFEGTAEQTLVHDMCAPFDVALAFDTSVEKKHILYNLCSYTGNKKFDLSSWWPSVVNRKTFLIFPKEFRATIFTILLARKRRESPLRILTNNVLWEIIFQMLRNPNDYKIQNGLNVSEMCLNTRCCQKPRCFCGNDFQYTSGGRYLSEYTFEKKAKACSPKCPVSNAPGKCIYFDFHCDDCEENIKYGADPYLTCTRYRCYNTSSCGECCSRLAPSEEYPGCHRKVLGYTREIWECSVKTNQIDNPMDVLASSIDFDVKIFEKNSNIKWRELPDGTKKIHMSKFIRGEMEKGKFSLEKLEEIIRLLLY